MTSSSVCLSLHAASRCSPLGAEATRFNATSITPSLGDIEIAIDDILDQFLAAAGVRCRFPFVEHQGGEFLEPDGTDSMRCRGANPSSNNAPPRFYRGRGRLEWRPHFKATGKGIHAADVA